MSRKNRSRTKSEPKPAARKRAAVVSRDEQVGVEAAEAIEVVDEVDVVDVAEAEGVVETDVVEIGEIVETAEDVDAADEAQAVDDVAEAVDVTEVSGRADAGDADVEAAVAAESEPAPESESVEATPDTASYEQLKPIIEALIFASPEPLTPKALFKLLESEPKEDVETALALLKQDYDRPGGLQLVEVAGGYQIVTRPELHEYVRRLFHERTSQKLSVQALETLAVVAYKQPITAPEITEVRGVNTSGVLNTLIDRKLVKIVGRKDVVGRPFMYATTREFLDKFGLKDINDLPKVEDLADVLGFEPPSLDGGSETEQAVLAFDFGESDDFTAAPVATTQESEATTLEPEATTRESEATTNDASDDDAAAFVATSPIASDADVDTLETPAPEGEEPISQPDEIPLDTDLKE